MEGVRHIEMSWRCSSCEGKNLGRFKFCQSCKNPKDGSEEYEMPADPSQAASVTDEGLLRMATAGPDWRCAYCDSDQRRLDNGCANCGASAVEGKEVPDPSAEPSPDAAAFDDGAPTGSGASALRGFFYVVGFIGLVVGLVAFFRWNAKRPRDYVAKVSAVHWERSISVERYLLAAHEGFKETLPGDALEVRSIGRKVHHHDKVLDGYDTERYTVQVPDGYRTESYTARVSCGQDCETTPRTCSEKCSSNKNGFATCRTSCSGGGQRCTTRYCDERRTRDIPKTRTESRTRQVPRYRNEPRYAEGFAYKRWEWQPARTVRDAGDSTPARWPESNVGKDLGPGEKERETRSEQYKVTLSYDNAKHSLDFTPETEAAFAPFARSSEHKLHTEKGQFQLDGAPLNPTRVY
jgi:hypothetical protein